MTPERRAIVVALRQEAEDIVTARDPSEYGKANLAADRDLIFGLANRIEEGHLPEGWCLHCGKEGCLRHCPVAENGHHVADVQTVSEVAPTPVRRGMHIGVTCKLCSQCGTFVVPQEEVEWE